MRIFYITNARMPTEKAHGLQIAKMCEVFGSMGHEVTLVVPRRQNPLDAETFSFYGLKPTFSLVQLGIIDALVFVRFLGPFAHWLTALSFFLRALLVRPPKDTLIYSRSPEIAWLFHARGYKTVCEVHDWPDSKEKIFLHFLRHVDLIPCNSGGTQSEFLEKGFSQAVVAPNGVDLDFFKTGVTKEKSQQRLGVDLQKKVVMYVGALEAWKGIHTLLAATKDLGSEYQTVIVGGRDEEVKVLKSEYPHALFLGYRPYRELPWVQQAADVLVVPNDPASIESEKYTSPIKIFAHMTSGVPIIASDLPSIREVLSESNAFLFKAGDAAGLQNIIGRVMADADAERVAITAQKDVAGYTWQKRATMILNELAA